MNESSSISLTAIIDDVADMVLVLQQDNTSAEKVMIPPFVTFLIYKAAAITTVRLIADIEPQANMRRLKILRNALKVTAERWLSGGEKLLDLL